MAAGVAVLWAWVVVVVVVGWGGLKVVGRCARDQIVGYESRRFGRPSRARRFDAELVDVGEHGRGGGGGGAVRGGV